MAENKTKYTTLQTENGTVLYPKTSVKAVKDFDTGKTQKEINKEVETDVEALKTASNTSATELSSIKQTLEEIKKDKKYYGPFYSESSLPAIPDDVDTNGWYATVIVKNGKDKFYIVDQDTKEWVEKGESTSIIYNGIKKVNGLEGLEGNVTIDATDINTSIDSEVMTIQEGFNKLKSISDEQKQLIQSVTAKHNVLYVTEAEMQDIDEIEDGQVVVCVEEGTYAQGSIYKLNAGVWEEITASGTEITDTLTLSKEIVIPALNGTMIYESIGDYGFEKQADDYFKSTNTINQTYSTVKLIINLNRSADLKFEFEQYSKYYLSSTYSFFGKIDTDFPDGRYVSNTYVHQNTSKEKNGVVMYENFPAGEHYIWVRFSNYYNGEEDYLKFKLTTNLEQEETSYLSTSEIKVDNNNNLQINGNDIVTTAGLFYKSSQIGTEENPIFLYKLEEGYHRISGNFRLNLKDNNIRTVPNDTIVYAGPKNEYENFDLYFIDCYVYGKDVKRGYGQSFIVLVGPSSTNFSPESRKKINIFELPKLYDPYDKDCSTLYIGMGYKYVPENEVSPIQKWYVDEQDEKITPIKELTNISDIDKTKYADKFILNSEENEHNLYFVKNKVYDKQKIELGNKIDNISFDVDLKNVVFYDDSRTQTLYIAYYDENNNKLSTSKLIISTTGDGSGKRTVYSLYFEYTPQNLGNNYLLKYGSWVISELKPTDFNSSAKYLIIEENNPSTDFNILDYMTTSIPVKEEETIRIALYEDLANAGGSGGSKPITQFEGPEYVWEDSYTNTFGTGWGNDNRLFFYKNNGIQEVDYPLQEYIDLKMQNLRIDEGVVDKLPISGTGTESVTFNLMKNNGEEIEVVLSVDYTDGVVNSVYIYPFTKEQQYLYQDGKWNYSLIPTSSFVEEADTMIYTSDPNSILVPFLSIVDKISGQQAIRVALYDDVASGGAGGESITLSKEVFVPEVPAKEGVTIDSVENISTDYGFELNENDYYESNNKWVSGNENYALCKVTFTVPKTMNIVWDVINSGEPNYDYGMFSNLNMELLNNPNRDDEQNTEAVFKAFRQESSSEVKKLVYENVEPGQYFITVKYRKDSGGDQGNDSLQFKLADESKSSEKIPSYTYESKGEIKVDDHNNLQIDGKNILKEGDIKEAIKQLKGTEENPIILDELEDGYYILSGYFKYFNGPQTYYVMNSSSSQQPGSKALIKVFYDELNQRVKILAYSSLNYNGNIMAGSPEILCNEIVIGQDWYSTQLYTLNDKLSEYSPGNIWKTALSVSNESEYEPTGDYNPATKKYVDDKEPISTNDSFEDFIKINDIISVSDVENNSLYYGKLKGQKEAKLIIKTGVQYEQLYLKKSIINDIKYTEMANTGLGFGNVAVYGNGNGTGTNFNYELDGEGKIKRIYQSYASGYLYDSETGWFDNSDEEYVDLIAYFRTAFDWAESMMFSEFHLYETNIRVNDYFVYPEIVDYAEPIRIALYEDLENASGGSNVADIEASIDNSTYVMTLKLVDGDGNQVGTEKTIDLPLESVVVGGTYNNTTKEIELTLQNGNKVKIPVSNLVGGLVPETRKINGKSLENDINLTAEDLGISFEGEPTIEANDGILTIKVNNTQVGQFSANQSDSSTINIEVPTTTSQLTNNSGFLTSSSSTITSLGTRIGNLEDAIPYLVVNELPTTGAPKTMYLLNSRNENGDGYDEYLWVNEKWEQVGKNKVNSVNSKTGTITLTASDIKTTYSNGQDSIQKVFEDMSTALEEVIGLTVNGKPISDNPVLTASDVGALPDTTTIPTRVGQLINDSQFVSESTLNNKAATLGSGINLTLDTTNYQISAQLVNSDGTAIGTAKTIDLPLETMVVGASYDDATEKITLTLKNGTTSSFSVADLVKGLVSDTRTINGKPLSSNITLSASDVGALPNTTTIPTVNNGTLTIQKNGTTVKTFTANSSSNVTANITVPTGTAADKNYTTTMDNSDNLPTAAAIQAYVTSRGYVTSSGSVASATNANSALTATNATNDAGGNNIATTYAKKSDLGTQATFTLTGTTLTIVPK